MTLEWRTSGSLASGSDDTDPYRPAARAADEDGTAPTACITNDTEQYFMLEFPDFITVDVAAIIGSNFHRLTGIAEVQIQVADDNTFAVNLQTVAEWLGAAIVERLVCVSLGLGLYAPVTTTGASFTAEFWRIRVEYAGTGELPAIGEVFLAQRWTPPGHPLLPLAIDAELTEAVEFEPRSGDTRTLALVRQRGVPELSWPLVNAAEQDAATVWGESVGAGAYPFLVILRPGSVPEATMLARSTEIFDQPWAGALHQVITVTIEEQAPFVAREA